MVGPQIPCAVLVDAVLECRVSSFIRDGLWSLVLARAVVALLFVFLLGLAIGVCGCAVYVGLALLLWVFVRFSSKKLGIFFLTIK
jgi:O-antigen ligase